jgi:putative ABC transport system ATP-binding protein
MSPISASDELAALRNRTIGFVFQGFNLLPRMTLKTTSPCRWSTPASSARTTPRKARRMLDKVGLGGYAESLPSRISGGQQQRVAIARALVNASLILADEPTGNLDSHTSEEIMALFSELNREGITIVLVTHEADIAAACHGGRCVSSTGYRQRCRLPGNGAPPC